MESIEYPAAPQNHTLSNYPALEKSWEFSKNKLTELNKVIGENLDRQDVSIVAAGSYGRLDACSESDLDYIVLVDRHDVDQKKIKDMMTDICKGLNIKSPNPTGVFSEIVPVSEMIDGIGAVDDNLCRLAQRMLLLMESRPIFNESKFRDVIRDILQKYLELVIEDTTKECVFFLNDVIRYFRSICVNYQFNVWKEGDKWVMRNVKLRHSRVIMYAGLLFLILNASKRTTPDDNKHSYLQTNVQFTPLEKIVSVYMDNGVRSYDRILGIYNSFIRKLSDPQIRKALRVDYPERYGNPHYSDLKVTSDALSTELTRFVFGRRGRWTDQVIEYLLF